MNKKLNPNLIRKRLQNTSLSKKTLEVILGGVLGDGSLKLHKNYKNARYAMRHSISQKTYIVKKAEMLEEISTANCLIQQPPDEFSNLPKIRYCSKALESLTIIYNILGGQKFEIKRNWLNHLSSLSLAIWWGDDGSIVSNGKQGCICTDNFSEHDIQILKNYLKIVWNVEAKIFGITKNNSQKQINTNVILKEKNSLHSSNKTVVHKRYRLYFSTKQLVKLLIIIMPHCLCKEMIYKHVIRYKDPNHQQRWISQMETFLPLNLRPFAKETFWSVYNSFKTK